jgi:catalase
MAEPPSNDPGATPPSPSAASKRARWVAVGAVVSAVGASFLYAGGWFSPRELTPARLVDTLEEVNGVHPGFRRNHAKGICARGFFESSGQGARLSRAVVFRPGRVAVVGRFALAGGMPYAADAVQTVRSMALLFRLPDREEWRTGMNAIPVFPVGTPEAFRDQLVATRPDPETGKPDPARVQAFLAGHPESARALQRIKAQAPASGFGNSRYNSLDAFEFVDAAGKRTPVRWSMVPEEAFAPAVAPTVAPPPPAPNFLFDDLSARVKRGPLRWHLVVTVGAPGDPTNDATLEWPTTREEVDAGTLTVDRIEGEGQDESGDGEGGCRTINFDPLVLPDGIAGSDDPLLSARSATYSSSFRRRAGEPASSSVDPGGGRQPGPTP